MCGIYALEVRFNTIAACCSRSRYARVYIHVQNAVAERSRLKFKRGAVYTERIRSIK